MYHQNLSGQWKFHQLGEKDWLPATVPGGVHTDLLALGKIPDPFVADNEKKVQWIGETDWEYRYEFNAAPEVLKEAKQILVCDGLDTLSEVSLNGRLLGKTNNMYRQWSWDVTGALRTRTNWPLSSALRCRTSPPNRRKNRSSAAATSPVDRICAKPPANGAGTGVPSCRPSACGRIFELRGIPRQNSRTFM